MTALALVKTFCMVGMVSAFAPLLEDNVAILDDVAGCPNPGPNGWADSYSVGDNCYCEGVGNFDHDIGPVLVDTPLGVKTVREVCALLGPGPGRRDRPLYNDIQCGNGPANNAGDEDNCPGRTEYGREGCKYIGPKWNFLPHLPPTKAPVKAPVKVPVAPVKVPVAPVKVPVAPVKAPVKVSVAPVKIPVAPVKVPVAPVKVPVAPVTVPVAPVKVPVAPVKVPVAPVKVPVAPVKAPTPVVTCGIERFNLWDASTDRMIKTLINGAQNCDNKTVNIEVVATACVDSVAMTLTGPNNFSFTNTEGTAPYFLFDTNGSDIRGRALAKGVYQFVAVPDGKLNLAQTISFTVRDC